MKALWEHSQKVTIYKPETKAARTLLLDFPASRMPEINFYGLSPPVCGMFLGQPEQTSTVMAEEIMVVWSPTAALYYIYIIILHLRTYKLPCSYGLWVL